MDCSPPGSSVYGIIQSRILEWATMPSSRESSPPRDWTCVSCSADRFFTAELLGKPLACDTSSGKPGKANVCIFYCSSNKHAGVGDGQGGLARCDSWGCKESETTERLNWTELKEENLSFSPTLKKLKYILHTVKFTLNFNAYVQFSGFSIFVMLYNYHHWFQNVFITQKETWVYHFSFPLVSKPWHPLIYWYFLSLLICPFWTFYMNC